MTAFVESCVNAAAGSAVAAERRSRHRPRARQLLRALTGKKNVLITTHLHPDPDAIASCLALCTLLSNKLPGAKFNVSVTGKIGGGLNAIFFQQADPRFIPWDTLNFDHFDAVLLLDTQPPFANNPLPASVQPLAVIDHHRSRGRPPKCAFCDTRSDVGATSSIIFSYFMELEIDISPDMAATLLFAIESDLAGAAGQPGELDNVALSSLTLLADTRKLYKMRYVDLPQSYYIAYAHGLNNALYYDFALMSHIDEIDTPEKPAIIADFLLRFDKAQWALVTAINGRSMVLSLRTNSTKLSAADIMKRLVRNLGEGGGHRTKAGGWIPLDNGTPTEIERVRELLRRRYLRALGIKAARGQRLVPKASLSMDRPK